MVVKKKKQVMKEGEEEDFVNSRKNVTCFLFTNWGWRGRKTVQRFTCRYCGNSYISFSFDIYDRIGSSLLKKKKGDV